MEAVLAVENGAGQARPLIRRGNVSNTFFVILEMDRRRKSTFQGDVFSEGASIMSRRGDGMKRTGRTAPLPLLVGMRVTHLTPDDEHTTEGPADFGSMRITHG